MNRDKDDVGSCVKWYCRELAVVKSNTLSKLPSRRALWVSLDKINLQKLKYCNERRTLTQARQ